MNKLKIVKLEEFDIPQVRNFIFGVLEADFGYKYNPVWHKDIDDVNNFYIGEKKLFLVLKDKNTIVGTIAARPYDRNYEFLDPEVFNGDSTISLWRHYILKSLRRKGLGRKMFKKIESFAKRKGYSYIYLHTQRNIPGSLEYWVSMGFEIVYESKDEFQTIHLIKQIF